jgi:hypothetical protein
MDLFGVSAAIRRHRLVAPRARKERELRFWVVKTAGRLLGAPD